MDLETTLAYIHAQPWQKSVPGLHRIRELMGRLGDPQESLRFVHVAGTNGKGSTCAMLAEVLRRSGYRTGLYTSPYIHCFQERMQVDGQQIPDDTLCALTERVKQAADTMADPPTEFERITAIAFCYFLEAKCDLVVLEVGLGGKLDATNVISAPEVSVITHIDLEHTEILGDTLEKIAGEKAGVIKPGRPVVAAAQSKEAEEVFRRIAAENHSPCRFTAPQALTLHDRTLDGQVLDYRHRKGLRLALAGTYQVSNAALALDALDALREQGWNIPEDAVAEGLAHVRWPGRFEVLSRRPLVLTDGAHNPNGVRELVRCLEQYLPGQKLLFLVGVMADKDYREMMELILPHAAGFITVTPPNPRALSAEALKSCLEAMFSGPVLAAGSVEQGIALALDTLEKGQALCAFGSLYQLGPIRSQFLK